MTGLRSVQSHTCEDTGQAGTHDENERGQQILGRWHRVGLRHGQTKNVMACGHHAGERGQDNSGDDPTQSNACPSRSGAGVRRGRCAARMQRCCHTSAVCHAPCLFATRLFIKVVGRRPLPVLHGHVVMGQSRRRTFDAIRKRRAWGPGPRRPVPEGAASLRKCRQLNHCERMPTACRAAAAVAARKDIVADRAGRADQASRCGVSINPGHRPACSPTHRPLTAHHASRY